MSYPLAITTWALGAPSETFIRRHIQDLLPGETVVVAGTADGLDSEHWTVACPVLVPGSGPDTFISQAMKAILKRYLVSPDYYRIKDVKRFLKKHKVQVVMGEYLHLSLQWLELAKESGIRFFAHAHGWDVSAALRDPRWQKEYLKYNQADGVITVSEFSRSRLINIGLAESKVHTIPCGVTVPGEPLIRSPQQPVKCLAVGRMTAKKAPIMTLEAFRRAAGIYPDLTLDYIGGGELLPAALQFVQVFDLAKRVRLHGTQRNEIVQKYLHEADIFLQHSMADKETGDEEGLPVAILEAMAQSLPIVSTRHAGIPEAVLEGTTGFLVDEGDTLGMAEQIVTLAHNPTLRQAMGTAGWRRAQENFTWEKERRDLLRVLGLENLSRD